jgi:hypothetical protein
MQPARLVAPSAGSEGRWQVPKAERRVDVSVCSGCIAYSRRGQSLPEHLPQAARQMTASACSREGGDSQIGSRAGDASRKLRRWHLNLLLLLSLRGPPRLSSDVWPRAWIEACAARPACGPCSAGTQSARPASKQAAQDSNMLIQGGRQADRQRPNRLMPASRQATQRLNQLILQAGP